jgi:hypothetical protein
VVIDHEMKENSFFVRTLIERSNKMEELLASVKEEIQSIKAAALLPKPALQSTASFVPKPEPKDFAIEKEIDTKPVIRLTLKQLKQRFKAKSTRVKKPHKTQHKKPSASSMQRKSLSKKISFVHVQQKEQKESEKVSNVTKRAVTQARKSKAVAQKADVYSAFDFDVQTKKKTLSKFILKHPKDSDSDDSIFCID